VASAQDFSLVAEKLLAEVARPCELAGREMNISVSLGLAMFPQDGTTVESLMKHADAAMYRAKREGRNRYHFFSPSLDEVATHRLQLESDIREGLAQRQFVVYYQPLLDATTGMVTGAEALVRWQRSPQLLMAPSQFIEVAEECGLIVPLGEQVLEQACQQLSLWKSQGKTLNRLAINVSPVQFAHPGFVTQLMQTVHRHGVDPQHIELEITETALMRQPEQTLLVLQQVRASGMKVALDDFGTGYSSLSHLRRFPVSTIKVDRSFVSEMHHASHDRQLVEAILAMAHSLQLSVVAEGVENTQQAQILKTLGCDTMQGYLFSPPVDAATMTHWLGTTWPQSTPVAQAQPQERPTS
jgi:EAL domain-containing protein (putative c-di-GMP-specific phosphodiesterase class I)